MRTAHSFDALGQALLANSYQVVAIQWLVPATASVVVSLWGPMSRCRSRRRRSGKSKWRERDMRLRAALAAAGGALILAAGLAGTANAEAVCSHDLRVLAQPRDGLTLLEKYKDEFKGLSGASFNIDYLNENDRRAKPRADASTVGKCNVYYIDEANVALFAKSNWVTPLLDYYPKDYDFADFDLGRQKVATFEDKVYFAPLTGGGDLLVYRKDLLEKAGVKVPTSPPAPSSQARWRCSSNRPRSRVRQSIRKSSS